MIAGLGIDLVEIARIAEMLERHGDALLRRILSPQEDPARIQSPDGATHLAGLFAAKEAVMKALGTGMAGAAFAEIRIIHSESGQPGVVLDGSAAATAGRLGVAGWCLSITHTKTTAGAVAIALEGKEQRQGLQATLLRLTRQRPRPPKLK